MNKKHVLIISTTIAIAILGVNYYGVMETCNYARSCMSFVSITINTLAIFIPVSLLSIITYKIRDEVFETWIKFVYVWIPLTLFLVYKSPEYGGMFFDFTKGVTSYLMSLLFVVISIIIILCKYFILRRRGVR